MALPADFSLSVSQVDNLSWHLEIAGRKLDKILEIMWLFVSDLKDHHGPPSASRVWGTSE